MKKPRRSILHLVLLIVLAATTVSWPVPVTAQQVDSDRQFLRQLERSSGPVDSRRLARLFLGIASTLETGQEALQLMQASISVRESERRSVTRNAGRRYAGYADDVAHLKSGVLDLLDRPDSPQQLFRVLNQGHRTCWRLDNYVGLLEAYGVRGRELMSSSSSVEACDRFRSAAFGRRVTARIDDVLASDPELAAENRYLREELAELEALLDALREE